MSIWRLQCAWQFDTIAPKDAMVITPHFETLNPTPDIQALCEDMVAGLESISPGTAELRVKGYDAQGSVKTQVAVVDGVALTTQYDYDAHGNLVKEKDAL